MAVNYNRLEAGTVPAINNELEKIKVALQDAMSLSGNGPNQLEATVDANSQRIINLPAPASDSEPLRNIDGKQYVDAAAASAVEADSYKDQAQLAASEAVTLGAKVTPVRNLVELLQIDTETAEDGFPVHVTGFYPDSTVGGGQFILKKNADLTQNNGGTFVSKAALQAWYDAAVLSGGATTENLQANLDVLFEAGTGTGDAFVRVNFSNSDIDLSHWGAVGDGTADDSAAFEAYNNSELTELNGVYGKRYLITKGFPIKSNKLYKGRFAKIRCGDPSSSEYNFLSTGENSGDGKYNWQVFDWEFENVYTENGNGEFRRCISAGDDSSDFRVHSNKFYDFYWNVFVTSIGSGPVNTNPDTTQRLPSNFEIDNNDMQRSLGNAVFIVKGPNNFKVHDNIINDVGSGRLEFGFGILIDFVSASEGSGDNGVKCRDGWVYRNKISKTRQGGVLNAGNDNIFIYENETSDIGFYPNGTAVTPISCGEKFTAAPVGGYIKSNRIGSAQFEAITVNGSVSVIDNEIEDACITSGVGYVVLGRIDQPWIDSDCYGNTINRVNGPNVAALAVRGSGSNANCTIGPNKYPGHVHVTSRHLNLIDGATIPSSCKIISQITSGVEVFSGDGTTRTFTFPHNIEMSGTSEISVFVTPRSVDSNAPFYVTVAGANFSVIFTTAPPAGTDNMSLQWQALDPLYNLR